MGQTQTTTLIIIITHILIFTIQLLASNPLTIKTRLIHRDSALSPLSNPTLTTVDFASRMVESSLARHSAIISSKYGDKPPSDIEARLVSGSDKNKVVFYVNFSIGDPPVQQLALLDTGGSLIWVRCPPCRPYCSTKSGATFFYSVKSKTYSPRPCTASCTKCTESWWPWSPPKECMYKVKYIAGQTSEGVYATDQLTFRTPNDKTTTVTNVLFGCSKLETGTNDLDPHVNGVFGLSNGGLGFPIGETSLVARLGSKFSYCIGSISDRSYIHNHLSFGDAVDLVGDPTPFDFVDGHYFVELLKISFGGQTLDINPGAFREGTTIDSGSEVTFLCTEAYEVLKAEVKKQASSLMLEEAPPPVGGLELCYGGSVEKEARGFLALGFHFEDDAELIVDSYGTFVQVHDEIFCLAVVRSSQNVSIVGVMAQQGYNVGYDLDEQSLYFQRIDCELLEG